MRYRPLGRTGVQVSELCLGTMTFGAEADHAESARMYSAARDRGVNFFDCANTYAKGRSEQVLGKLIASHRDEIVLTSKTYNAISKDINGKGSSRRYLVKAVEQSLQRLGTDRIDVLFMHRFDPLTPLEETLRGLEDLVRAGKILYPGASNFAAWQVAKALGIAERHAWSRFEVMQPMYNLVKRQAEVEILPLAQSEELGVMCYSPVGGGLLSGKYGKDKRPVGARLVDNAMYGKRYSEQWAYETAGEFTALCEQQSVHPVSMAVAWAGAHPQITSAIIGGRTAVQLEPALAAPEVEMTPELYARISALSRTPPPATDRLESQA
jgi:aryl-alcohol dehydrogenase-like predicted oxidoreductase